MTWSKKQILAIMRQPFLDLVFQAASVHRQYHDPRFVQLSSLVSIKTGGCPEDCAYCPQAARYATGINTHGLLSVAEVTERAKAARAHGVSRICLGAAWRKVRDNTEFERLLDMVREVSALDVEVCCTLGLLTETQAKRLEEAGLSFYNHNLDTSAEYYETIISTRTYKDRLETLCNVRKAKLSVCSGGIIGMGESEEDRAGLLLALACLDPPPESVPINALVPVKGTPLGERTRVDAWQIVRMVATARIVMPLAVVRLSAGRTELGESEQAFCFFAGANSVFTGDKLLTAPNPEQRLDEELFRKLDLRHTRQVGV